MLPTVSLTGLP